VGRYIGPTCKLARREGTDLLLKSRWRDIKSKCRFDALPGDAKNRSRQSDYGIQLRMKQMIRRYYGVSEKQFRGYYKIADHRKGATGTELLRIIESRLDNVVYRLGFAVTRAEARQLVSHKSVLVNGRIVNIPSLRLKPGDVVSIRDKAKGQLRINAAIELCQRFDFPAWLDVDYKSMSGGIKSYPEDDDFPVEFKVNLVVELYSK
jgi:small subunit ribosomal protein S4